MVVVVVVVGVVERRLPPLGGGEIKRREPSVSLGVMAALPPTCSGKLGGASQNACRSGEWGVTFWRLLSSFPPPPGLVVAAVTVSAASGFAV